MFQLQEPVHVYNPLNKLILCILTFASELQLIRQQEFLKIITFFFRY